MYVFEMYYSILQVYYDMEQTKTGDRAFSATVLD